MIRNVFKPKHKASDVSKLNIDGNVVDDPEFIVDKFNEYFCNIGQNLSRVIPESHKTFQSFLENPNHNSLFLLPTTVEELFDIVHSLKNK